MCSDPETVEKSFLSHDLIIEILRFLPEKSLLRFKCVCKSWCAVIQGIYFIEKRGQRAYDWECDPKEFGILAAMHGLVMEKSNLSHKYRIRNPMTSQVLDLPDPQAEQVFSVCMFYVLATQNYKLFSLCYDKRGRSLACQVLTVGTDSQWRELNVPCFSNLRTAGLYDCSKTRDMFFLLRYGAAEICCIEVASECILSVTVPKTLTLSGWEDDVFPRYWDGKLSLIKLERKNLLHAWVLEDYKKQKWAEKKIVLEFMNMYPDTKTNFCLMVSSNWLLVYVDENGKHLLGYNLDSKRIIIHGHYRTTRTAYKVRTSLVYIEGMQTEETNIQGRRIIN